MRMKWASEIYFLATLRAAANDLKISGNSSPFLIVHGSCFLVADPGVSTSPARVDPHDVLETKVVPQCDVDDLDSHGHELPAIVAYICLVAARSDIVVVC